MTNASTNTTTHQSPHTSITRLLVANRGEIARRIMATCCDQGIETVAVFSEPDTNAAFVHDADLSVALGGSTPAESYLRGDAVIAAALATGADAIHPGYGFLSENAEFAAAVGDAGLIFVGPTPEAIASMGSKLEAKRQMAEAGVPLLPSAELTGLSGDDLTSAARGVGYPLLIKASAGGGGRGMRIVPDEAGLVDAVASAAREAESAFGDGTIYAERYVSPSRHVEVQIFGDSHGSVVHFHERECSIQRRHQKIIEEAPSPSLDPTTRAALHAAAVNAGKAMGYTNAGTVEFLLAPPDESGSTEFFFLEVNTRLQVEHPVTEAVMGLDLVALQLDVASGGHVPTQDEIGEPTGHAIEARVYAEDPKHDFRPSTGSVHAFVVPGDVRLDSALDEFADGAGSVSQFYDPMIAKVITHAETRTAAARRLAGALAGATIDGITTNRSLLVNTLRHSEFIGPGTITAGRLDQQADSSFLERHNPADLGRAEADAGSFSAAALAIALAEQAASRGTDSHTAGVSTGFRNVVTQPQSRTYQPARQDDAEPLVVSYLYRRGTLQTAWVGTGDTETNTGTSTNAAAASPDDAALDDMALDVTAHSVSPDLVDITVDGIRRRFSIRHHASGETPSASATWTTGHLELAHVPLFVEPGEQVEAGSTVATMPGTIVAVEVSEGDAVEAGDTLVVMEAMKMELSITAAIAGVVTSVPVNAGDTVEAGSVLAIVEVGADAETPPVE